MADKLVKRTPCIGVCSTTYGDDICRGCRRFRHEITSWIEYTDSEKSIINRRLEKFKITVLEEKFHVRDSEKFKEALLEAKVRFNQDLKSICWVFDLLRHLDTENLNLEEFSLKVREEYIDKSLSQLKDDINKEFYELSLAHYQRYMQPRFFNK
tara:strand:+ start:222 stop:683 length:462 start_codon:yes stop_codon:yes gene_type:complete